MLKRAKRLSAMVTPNGIHLVEYRRGTRGLQILNYTSESPTSQAPAAVLDQLARTVEARGGRGGRLAVTISGLGSAHQILSLPRADREILLPVVEREMRRFYPTAFAEPGETLVDFVPVGSEETDELSETRELLATAVPRELIDELVKRLDSRGVVLEHLTILPRTIERLFESFTQSDRTCALLLLIPRAPLLGFFHQGRLRLFSEPIVPENRPATGSSEIVEHVRRGDLFLRQQFQGASVERLLVAAAPGGTTLLENQLEIPIHRFDAYSDAPGALAALGAALDADEEDGFNLLPGELRQPTAAERWIRFAMAIGAAVLIAAGSWWTADAVARESQAETAAAVADGRVADVQSAYSALLPTLEARRGHASRIVLADSLNAGKRELMEILYSLDAVFPEVQVVDLTLDNDGSGWSGTLSGRTNTDSSQDASAAVENLIAQLNAGLTTTGVVLGSFSFTDPTTNTELMAPVGLVAVDFQISFIVGGSGVP